MTDVTARWPPSIVAPALSQSPEGVVRVKSLDAVFSETALHARLGLHSIRRFLSQVTSILADGGYSGKSFADAVKEKLGANVQIAKRSELHTFAVMPQRWVVERSFAWLDKCRRLLKNCERKLNTSLQTIHFAFLVLLLRRS